VPVQSPVQSPQSRTVGKQCAMRPRGTAQYSDVRYIDVIYRSPSELSRVSMSACCMDQMRAYRFPVTCWRYLIAVHFSASLIHVSIQHCHKR